MKVSSGKKVELFLGFSEARHRDELRTRNKSWLDGCLKGRRMKSEIKFYICRFAGQGLNSATHLDLMT